jgi:peptidoglycan/LPS O-acetylase OafA/YrhL
MLMINDGKIVNLVDGSYWTLTFELLFYFYIGIFVWLFSVKKIFWFYFGWLGASFFLFYFGLEHTLFAKLACIRFTPYFVFGGVLALLIDRYKHISTITRIVYIMTLVFSVLLPIYISKILLASKEVVTNSTGMFTIRELIVVESFFIIILLAVFFSFLNFTKLATVRSVCLALGGITYPLYLLHSKIGNTLIKHYSESHENILLMSYCYVIFIVLISYTISVYELRLRKFIKWKYFQ